MMRKVISITLMSFFLSACANTQEKLQAFGSSVVSGASKIIPSREKNNSTPKKAPLSAPIGEHSAMMMDSSYDKPIDYIPEALGVYEWQITTTEPKAQEYFKQGMQLRWAYNVNEAARSMAEARRLDPNCAMCYWGEAFALGSFLNGHMTTEKGMRGRKAILRAIELADGNTSTMEKELIMATLVRYPENWTTEIGSDKEKRRPTYQAYADNMAEVYKNYPNNHEIATLYGQALFMLEERRGYRDLNSPSLIHLHSVLTGVLDENIAHPGACHLYIHATESTNEPERASECADNLSDAIPVASHIQHMPAHTYNRTGMWGKNVLTSIKASQSDIMAKSNKGFSYGASHNLHMLLYGASWDGQGAVAIQAGKDYRKITDMAPYETLTQIRFGRFEEVLENNNPPKDKYALALYKFTKGYAALKTGDIKTAKTTESDLFDAAKGDLGSQYFRGDYKATLVEIVAYILQGEIKMMEGDLSGALDSFNASVKAEKTLGFSEPGPLPFSAHHWLGAALIEAGNFSEAESVYRNELKKHPHNGWSLFGLREALAGQNINDPKVDADFEDSWARSNLFITSSRF